MGEKEGKKRRLPPNGNEDSVIALDTFANRRDQGRLKKRKAKDREFYHKAALKKKYQRLLTKETGTKISSKKEFSEPNDDKTEKSLMLHHKKSSNQSPEKQNQSNKKKKKRKPLKPDSFGDARRAAEDKKKAMQERQNQLEKIRVLKKKKQKERNKKHGQLTKKTKTGQPLMKNTIDHLLEKIKKSCS
mmetsp:Transcript_27536/g.47869  ORF Transcript_27536/g.47869 Transcript_27536/m.47869 type:complete len:188 (+) Transcript_27536:94-657(+)